MDEVTPKQFLSLHGEMTILQRTVDELKGLPIESSVTICNEEHRFFVAEQLRAINKLRSIILEPVGEKYRACDGTRRALRR